MDKTFSIYLDIVRFVAAVMIFLGHASYSRFSGGVRILWIFDWLSADLVMVFFVLSGIVISYVANEKEKSLEQYSISRLSRLYSVVLPALLLTILLDYFGPRIAYKVYDGPWFTTSNPFWRFFANLFFVNELWFSSVESFSNWPFWSLGYEFWYYVIFGVAHYVRSPVKYYILPIIFLFVGPKILLLFPVWLLGVWVYFVNKKNPVAEPVGWVLVIGTIVVYALFRVYDWPVCIKAWQDAVFGSAFNQHNLNRSTCFLNRYVTGIMIALHFIGIFSISHRLRNILSAVEVPVIYMSGYTFSIYLFHYPALYFFSAISSKFISPPLQIPFFLISTVMVAWMLGTVTERKKSDLKNYIFFWYVKMVFIGNNIQPVGEKVLSVARSIKG